MSKIQVTTALERQIPEFIREDYATFVKFVKAYYEFLSQTDSRNLEDIRSIDRTLDEFVLKFKKELAAIFPTGTIQNERMFLEYISDFYNSRGSVESYQLLFRVLFNKDVEVFYPSTQILKASDGKWVQEKSIFVKTVNGDLFDFKGKIIQIKTTKKIINVFSPNVIAYRDDIFEVFLDKQYYDDIEIGNEVTLNGTSGVILPCPAKYKIVREGKGFEIGSIYNLPTAQGDGSVIKITRVGSQGEIKAIQIISFGLDYSSNFYAQLSNKTTQALAYYHPITEFIAGMPREYPELEPSMSYGPNPATQEQVSDYINFGYFINQNYFFYDPGYFPSQYNPETSVEQSDMLQTVWFADTTYVGDIIASFYTNEAGIVIDEDAAEIKIELGPVAAYPGYYATNDGFISDECYIHDGDYYQLYSYVVKVEEQLENYKEIVKSLLQPAGLKLFGEYNIFKNFDVVATPLLAYIRRQLFDQIFQINETQYKDHTKANDDTISSIIDRIGKDVEKPASDSMIFLDGIVSKNFGKNVSGEDSAQIVDNDISSKNVTKPIVEVVASLAEVVQKSLDRINEDFTTILDALVRKDFGKLVNDDITSLVETTISSIGLIKQETAQLDDSALISVGYGFIDRVDLTDFIAKQIEQTYLENISTEDALFLQRILQFADSYDSLDTYAAVVDYIRTNSETMSVDELETSLVSKFNTETLTTSIGSFILSIMYERSFEETINNFIEGSTLYFNPFSESILTPSTADDLFAEDYVVNSTSTIT